MNYSESVYKEFVDLGDAYYKEKKFDLAIEIYYTADAVISDQLELLIALAEVYLDKKDFKSSLIECKKALSKQPDNIKALVIAAKCYKILDAKNFQEVLEKISQIDCNNEFYLSEINTKVVDDEARKKINALRTAALEYRSSGMYTNCEDTLNLICSYDNDCDFVKEEWKYLKTCVKAHNELVKLMETKKDTDNKVCLLKKLISLSPNCKIYQNLLKKLVGN